MPTVLALETSTELASAALLHDGRITTREASGVQTHSRNLLPMVQALLAESGIALAQCDAIAFGAGPGSFTGVRTACGVAQGLGFGIDRPLVPIVSLEAMAQACFEKSGAEQVLAVLDARMEEVYWAQYRLQDGRWETVLAPRLGPAASVAAVDAPASCGNGLQAYAAAFADPSLVQSAVPGIVPHAGQVARLAVQALADGRAVHARDASPLYLRDKVALTTRERAARAAA